MPLPLNISISMEPCGLWDGSGVPIPRRHSTVSHSRPRACPILAATLCPHAHPKALPSVTLRRLGHGPCSPWPGGDRGMGAQEDLQGQGASGAGPGTPAWGTVWATPQPHAPPRGFSGTHSKSVSFLSSVTGLKATAFFFRPITQAESGALANTRPANRGTWEPSKAGPCPREPGEGEVRPQVAPTTYPCGKPHAASPTAKAWPSPPAWSRSSGQRGLGRRPGNRQGPVPGAALGCLGQGEGRPNPSADRVPTGSLPGSF